MKELEFGQIISSKAGHDAKKTYICLDFDEKYVMLADGEIKKLANPKKKSVKHIAPTNFVDETVKEAKEKGQLTDEIIKRAIKLYLKKRN